jgi:anti-sigma B factor antagonist
MKIDVRENDGVVIAALRGRLHRGVGDEALRQVINELLSDGRRSILLDLSEMRSIDSSGMGELVASLKVARELSAEIKILQVQEGVRETLNLARLLPLFDVYNDEAEAVAGFASSS